MKHSINVWALAVAAGLLVACTEKVTDDSVPVGGVSVEPSSLTLEIGQTSVLRASVLPSDADEQGVTWTSSDESVAVVDVDGTVTALAAGSAVVTATTVDGGFTDDCSVTVNEAVTEPEFVDLGSAGTANCYVVTGPGNYKFDATVMGNGASTEGITPEALSGICRPGMADPQRHGDFSGA